MTTTTTSPLPPQSQNVPSTLSTTTSQPYPSEESYNTQIDSLLTRYLHLLNEYTTLRSSLSSVQAGMYQNLARANFAAERGVRYGKEYFDERMVAGRRVRVGVGKEEKQEGVDECKGEGNMEGKVEGEGEGGQKVEFKVVKVDEDGNEAAKAKEEEDVSGKKNEKDDGKEENTEQNANEAKEQNKDEQNSTNPTDRQKEDTSQEPEKVNDDEDSADTPNEKQNKIKKIRNDPLRWFGLLTPLPLRLAQSQAIEAVEQIIPRLVTVNAEMAQVEIEVRRARKRREKAVKAAKGAKAEGVVEGVA